MPGQVAHTNAYNPDAKYIDEHSADEIRNAEYGGGICHSTAAGHAYDAGSVIQGGDSIFAKQ